MRFAICVILNLALAVPSAIAKTADCYCTDRAGSRVELGQTICMQVDGRMFMAQCQMSQNVPMWREVGQGCLSSQARPFSESPVPLSQSTSQLN
jgi:hypothetical protein